MSRSFFAMPFVPAGCRVVPNQDGTNGANLAYVVRGAMLQKLFDAFRP